MRCAVHPKKEEKSDLHISSGYKWQWDSERKTTTIFSLFFKTFYIISSGKTRDRKNNFPSKKIFMGKVTMGGKNFSTVRWKIYIISHIPYLQERIRILWNKIPGCWETEKGKKNEKIMFVVWYENNSSNKKRITY